MRSHVLVIIASFFLCNPCTADNNRVGAVHYNNLGVEALRQEHFLDAIEELSIAVALDPNYSLAKTNLAKAHNDRGAFFYRSQKLTDALSEFQQAVNLEDNPVSQGNLGRIIVLLKKNPRRAKDRTSLGDAALMREDLIGADVEYKASLKLKHDPLVQQRLQRVNAAYEKRKNLFSILTGWANQLNQLRRSQNQDWSHERHYRSIQLVQAIDGAYNKLSGTNLSCIERAKLRVAIECMDDNAWSFFKQYSKYSRRATLQPTDRKNDAIPAYWDSQGKEHILSDSDLNFGEKQMSLVLRDKPEMIEFVRKDDEVWNWCVRQFAGQGTGCHYFWQGKTDPAVRLTGWHILPTKDKPGEICIQRVTKMPFDGDDSWSALIFELLNIRNDSAFAKNNALLANGNLSHSSWLRETARLEFATAQSAAHFFKKYWQPHCERLNKTGHGLTNWFSNIPISFENWFEGVPPDSAYLDFYKKQKTSDTSTGSKD